MNRIDEIILDRDESVYFVHNLIHPDMEALRRREVFLSSLDDIEIEYCDGGMVAEFPDISLLSSDDSLYERKKVVSIWNESTLQIDSGNGSGRLFNLFDEPKKSRYGATHIFQDERVYEASNVFSGPDAA